jgi:hypothetical protein
VATKASETVSIYIPEISKGRISVYIVGTQPLICNRMSQKVLYELIAPHGKKGQAERQATLKHLPIEEFQASPYTLPDTEPTLIALMSSAYKGAMCTAALDLPGPKKAQIGRLVYVEQMYVPVYGTPKLFCSVVRNSDINHTPDVRTRAILPRWACKVDITFVQPILNAQAIISLLSAGGTTVGVGDWRPEKGKGNFGQFSVVNANDPELLSIMAEGRAVQVEAMANPVPFDADSADLLRYWTAYAKAKGKYTDDDDDSEDEEETA